MLLPMANAVFAFTAAIMQISWSVYFLRSLDMLISPLTENKYMCNPFHHFVIVMLAWYPTSFPINKGRTLQILCTS